MIIVGTDRAAVEADLCDGRLSCPTCKGELRPWGHGIERDVRLDLSTDRRRFRRSICRSCGGTHMLIHEDTLLRRRDGVAVIGRALVAKARGSGHRRIAALLGRSASTVRGWLRRFSSLAGPIREHAMRWAHILDPTHEDREPGGAPFVDAVSAIGVLGVVATKRFGPRPVWSMASVVTGGCLLANTSSPFRPMP